MLTEFSPRNPFRVPQWRWERARNVVEDNSPLSRRMDDNAVRRAVHFRRRLELCNTPQDVALLEMEESPMFWAYEIFSARQESYQGLKNELEARILAQDTPEHVASRCCISPLAVKAYEEVFFNVTDRIQNTGYILHQVIGPRLHRGLQARDYAELWKLFGYFGGPIVLNMMIDQCVDPQRPVQSADLVNFVKDHTTKTLTRQAAVAAQTLTINPFSQTEILDLFTKLLAIDKQAGPGTTGADSSYQGAIRVMMEAVHWVSGPREAPAGVEPKLLEKYDKLPVELSASEVMRVATGTVVPVDAVEEEWTFPEPRTELPQLAEDK